jgi:hypothetical protein
MKQPIVEAGSYGFADFGKQIQNAFLKRDDPAQMSFEELQEHTALLRELNAGIRGVSSSLLATHGLAPGGD